MDVHAEVEAPCTPDELFALIDDLVLYPSWIDLVHRAIPDGVEPPAWQIELRARVGPLARSKRLRMVRAEHDPEQHRVTFERRESDGRRHSPWVLRAGVRSTSGTSSLHMHLHYGGGLWTGGVLERVLADQITSGRERLLAMLNSTR